MGACSSLWKTAPLGELADLRNGLNYTKANFGRGLRVIGVKDFQDRLRVHFDELEEIDPLGVARPEDMVKGGDIVFVRSNGNRQLIGRSMFVSKPEGDVSHSGFTIRVRFTSPGCLPEFYAYYFRSPAVREALSAHGGGTNIANLNQQILRNLLVPVPPMIQQQRIAETLSAYDDLIENNTRRIAILEEMARNLYREWFVEFRFPGHEQGAMVESELEPIPDGWAVVEIGNVVETLGGGTPSTKRPEYWENGDINWFSPSDLTAAKSMFVFDSSKRITAQGLQSSSARLFPARSVMMTSRATIGVLAINTTPACTNQGFITCVPNDRLSAFQTYFWLQENRSTIESIASGATFKEINRTNFRKMQIAIPPEEVSRRFNDLVEPIGGQIENLLRCQRNLRETRDLLLPKLMSGETAASTSLLREAPSRPASFTVTE